jgi:hypothetical protein
MIYENTKTKITVEHYGVKCSIETETSDLTATEVVEIFASLMFSMSFMPQQITDAMAEYIESRQ